VALLHETRSFEMALHHYQYRIEDRHIQFAA